ncbi:MAG: hypothetical protein LQ340_005923, partial [Diploschistes diacapsis]
IPDGDFSETTSTLVLTSQTNHYVDIRIFKPRYIASAFETPYTKSTLPTSRLDWAFAGTAESTTYTRRQSSSSASSSSASKDKLKELTPLDSDQSKNQDQGNPPSTEAASTNSYHKRIQSGSKTITARRTTWTHWVDSRHSKGIRSSIGASRASNPSSILSEIHPSASTDDFIDTGTIYPTERDNECIEKGRMPHPDTGLMTDYEELWRDLPPQKLTHEPGALSFVLKAENKVLGTRGLIIRVGSWCQGVIRSGADIGVERWRFGGVPLLGGGEGALLDGAIGRVDEGLTKNMWERVVKIGEMSLPCQVCWEKGWELKVGEEVVSGGLKWEVVEKFMCKE